MFPTWAQWAAAEDSAAGRASAAEKIFSGKRFGRSDNTKSDTTSIAVTTSSKQLSDGNMPQGFDGEPPADFDPSNIPESFDGQMPEGFTPPDKQNSSTENSDGSETRDSKSSRPGMNSFPDMNGNAPQDNTRSYILLGVSAAVLLAGVVFALRFTR